MHIISYFCPCIESLILNAGNLGNNVFLHYSYELCYMLEKIIYKNDIKSCWHSKLMFLYTKCNPQKFPTNQFSHISHSYISINPHQHITRLHNVAYATTPIFFLQSSNPNFLHILSLIWPSAGIPPNSPAAGQISENHTNHKICPLIK